MKIPALSAVLFFLTLAVACAPDTAPAAIAAANAALDCGAAGYDKATAAVTNARAAAEVVAAVNLYVAAKAETERDLRAGAAKYPEASPEKVRNGTEDARDRCARAAETFLRAFTHLDTKLLNEDEVIQVISRM